MDENIKVYIKIDESNNLVAINSSLFVFDTTNWFEIDEGRGEMYAHAQNYYLKNGLLDKRNLYNYKFLNGKVIEKTEDEKSEELASRPPLPKSQDEEIAELKQLIADLAALQLGV